MGSSSPSPSPPPLGNTVYCCVAKGGRIIHSYNGGDRELEALASECVENAPPFHAWYSHTVKERTFGFLIEDGYTYFAIVDPGNGESEPRPFVDPSAGNSEARRFLERLRDGFKKAAKNGLEEELVPIICRLICSLESMSQHASGGSAAESTDTSTRSSRSPLLGNASSKQERRKSRDKGSEACDAGEDHSDRGVKIDVAHDPVGSSPGAVALRKSSSSRARAQQHGRRTWRRLLTVVIVVDVLLCLVLFGVWLLVCRGFQCVS